MNAKAAAIQVDKISYGVRPHFYAPYRLILNDVSCVVAQGEVCAFLGPNGAGKTTLLKCMVGLLRAQTGQALLFGQPASHAKARQGMGFLPERTYYPPYLSAREMVMGHGILQGLSYQEARQKSTHMLGVVGLGGVMQQKLKTFSKGMLQRAGLAQALVAAPKLLILDEPLSGLDPLGRKDVRDLIVQQQRLGTTILFSTHVLADVESICDHVVVLVGGKIRTSGKPMALAQAIGAETGIDIVAENVGQHAVIKLCERGFSPQEVKSRIAIEAKDQQQANIAIDILRHQGADIIQVNTKSLHLENLFVVSAKGEHT